MSNSPDLLLRIVGPPFTDVQQGQLLPESSNLLDVFDDGSVRIYSGKVEYGQGIRNSFARTVAAIMNVPVDSVEVVLGDTSLVPWDRGTVASASTRTVGMQLVRAARTAAKLLPAIADEDISGRDEPMIVEVDPTIEGPEPDLIEGAARIDGPDRVTGRTTFASDFEVEGTTYGKIIRPPVAGSRPVRVDSARAEQVAGFISVVTHGDLVGVVADSPIAVKKVADSVRVQWVETYSDASDFNLPLRLKEHAGEVVDLASDGNIDYAKPASSREWSNVYYAPYIANAQMEPSSATAKWDGDSLTVWCAHRAPFTERETLAQELAIPTSQIRVISLDVGGSFGTKSASVSVEAAQLARAVGKPVKISYTREEEFRTSTVRPAALIEIESSVDSNGRINTWDYIAYHAGENAFRGRRGAETPYKAAAARVRVAVSDSPLAHGSYRSLGGAVNHFAREVHIDRMARDSGIDPADFRSANLDSPRHFRVLEKVVEDSKWTQREKKDGIGFGLAVGFDAGSYVAQVARVDTSGNVIRVTDVWTAFDCGQIFNPEGIINQVEGAVVMGIGSALWEEVEFDGRGVLSTGFDSYRVPRISDVPNMHISIIDDPSNTPSGAGEPGIVPISAAIANAVSDALAIDVDRLPLQPLV
jgi:nicotinate dehydrogenase subunit B